MSENIARADWKLAKQGLLATKPVLNDSFGGRLKANLGGVGNMLSAAVGSPKSAKFEPAVHLAPIALMAKEGKEGKALSAAGGEEGAKEAQPDPDLTASAAADFGPPRDLHIDPQASPVASRAAAKGKTADI